MGPINRPRGIVALTAAVAPHSLSCLVSRHAPLGPRDIDGGLDRLRFGSDAYISLYDGATNLLRGGNPVITISKQKGVVRLPPNRGGIDYKESHAGEAEEVRR